jgi:hypothetical protein
MIAPSDDRDHMARVRVSDEVWAEFRIAVGWQPINTYLGGPGAA